jgi:hypothetical protein
MNLFCNKYFISILVFLVFLKYDKSRSEVKDNLEIINNQLIGEVSAAIDSIQLNPTYIQIILNQNDNMGEWWKANIRKFLIERNFLVNENDFELNDDNFYIVLERAQLDIKYFPSKRNIFLKTSDYQRNISGSFSFFIKDQVGIVLFSRSKEFTEIDEIKASSINDIENSFFLFTYGTKMESKFIKRLVEPILVTAATVGVVYLFYSLRSGTQ